MELAYALNCRNNSDLKRNKKAEKAEISKCRKIEINISKSILLSRIRILGM